jgi:hypothetical protein
MYKVDLLGIKVHTGVVEGWAYTVPGGYIT